MKRLLVGLVALSALLLCNAASAGGSVGNVTIVGVLCQSDGHCFIELSQNISGLPSCATYQSWFVIDIKKAEHQGIFASALLAQAEGRKLDYTGSGACSDWYNAETPWWIQVH